MPAERLPMRKVREVLRLKHACGASDRVIAQSGPEWRAIQNKTANSYVIEITVK